MEIKLNIQLFAEGEDGTPTEEVETPVEETETPDDVEFDDNSNEEESKEETKAEDKKKKNADAYKRRIAERERKKQQESETKKIEDEKRKAYLEGFKRSSGGTNRFTNKPLTDDADVEEYEIMLRLEQEGKDPIDDYFEELKKIKREEKTKADEAKRAELEKKNKADNDINSFIEKYGKDTIDKLAEDDDFSKYADKYVGRIPLTEIYENYLDFTASIETRADKLAKEKDARRRSSSGGLGNEYKPEKSYSDMSDEEFSKIFRGMLNNYN